MGHGWGLRGEVSSLTREEVGWVGECRGEVLLRAHDSVSHTGALPRPCQMHLWLQLYNYNFCIVSISYMCPRNIAFSWFWNLRRPIWKFLSNKYELLGRSAQSDEAKPMRVNIYVTSLHPIRIVFQVIGGSPICRAEVGVSRECQWSRRDERSWQPHSTNNPLFCRPKTALQAIL